MTDCGNAEIRDLLPDLAAGLLSPVEASHVQTHVDSCPECLDELALIRTARSVRPKAVVVDVAKIVAQLPKPSVGSTVGRAALDDGSIVSLDAHRAQRRERRAVGSSTRGVWRLAAGIGLMLAGGWSVLMLRSGGLSMMTAGNPDSLRLSDVPAGSIAPSAPVVAATVNTEPVGAATSAVAAAPASAAGVSVSFGGLTDYTDEELQRVLDRLDKWDGATSTEVTASTTPILPVNRGGLEL